MKKLLDKMRRSKFEAIQQFLVPRSKNFSTDQKNNSADTINSFIEEKSNIIAGKIIVFIWVIDLTSLFLYLKLFRKLSEVNKDRVMRIFFDSPVPLLRKGFWGLNTLAKLGVYAQTSIYPDIGYELGEINGK